MDLLNDFRSELLHITSYDDYEEYFNSIPTNKTLRGVRLKIAKKFAKSFYNFALNDIVITSVNYDELIPLLDAGSISYMGKYLGLHKVKVNCVTD